MPEMPTAGTGYRVHVTGLTHDRRGYPVLTPEIQREMVERLVNKIRRQRRRDRHGRGARHARTPRR